MIRNLIFILIFHSSTSLLAASFSEPVNNSSKKMDDYDYLLSAIKKNNFIGVKFFLPQVKDINSHDRGWNALQTAAAFGCKKIVFFLLNNQASILGPDALGHTAMSVAAMFDQTRIMWMLLQHSLIRGVKLSLGDLALLEEKRVISKREYFRIFRNLHRQLTVKN